MEQDQDIEQSSPMTQSAQSLSVSVVKRLLILAVIAGAVGGAAASAVWAGVGSGMGTCSLKSSKQLVVQESSAIISVAKKVSPSVVSIESKSTVNGFFGPQEAKSSGTGIIIGADGLIMTNRHVVSDVSATYTVTMSTGRVLKNAKVLARDSFNDIAFIRVDDKDLPAAAMGDSSALQIGQRVVAIGNALGRFQNTVTEGIISGIGRPIEAGSASSTSGTEALTNLLQTDTAINSGNSGGPLVNLDGQVVGMNTAVASDAQNIGFAIPIDDAKSLIASVVSTGKIVRPYLGVRFVTLTKEIATANGLKVEEGAWLRGTVTAPSVVNGSPADKGGLKEGDVIVKLGGDDVTAASSLPSVVAKHKAGERVEVVVMRDGKKQTLTVMLEEVPKS